MSVEARPDFTTRTETAGFAVLDDKGRVSLPAQVRRALGLRPGSSVAYIVADGMVLLLPQDEHLAHLMDQATQALEAAGITVEQFMANLPAARAEVVNEAYGPDFLLSLERRYGQHEDGEPASSSDDQ